jgi:hypothetical protein
LPDVALLPAAWAAFPALSDDAVLLFPPAELAALAALGPLEGALSVLVVEVAEFEWSVVVVVLLLDLSSSFLSLLPDDPVSLFPACAAAAAALGAFPFDGVQRAMDRSNIAQR